MLFVTTNFTWFQWPCLPGHLDTTSLPANYPNLRPPTSQPVSYASGAANLDTYNVIALTNQNDVIHAEETDISQVSVVREMGTGCLDWAGGAPNDSKPFMCT